MTIISVTKNVSSYFAKIQVRTGKLLTASYNEYSQRGHEVRFAQWNFLWNKKCHLGKFKGKVQILQTVTPKISNF